MPLFETINHPTPHHYAVDHFESRNLAAQQVVIEAAEQMIITFNGKLIAMPSWKATGAKKPFIFSRVGHLGSYFDQFFLRRLPNK
jgi:hypothetical protein